MTIAVILTVIFTGLTAFLLYLNRKSKMPSATIIRTKKNEEASSLMLRITSQYLVTIRDIVIERKEGRKYSKTPFKYEIQWDSASPYGYQLVRPPFEGIPRRWPKATVEGFLDYDISLEHSIYPPGKYRLTVFLDRGRCICKFSLDGTTSRPHGPDHEKGDS